MLGFVINFFYIMFWLSVCMVRVWVVSIMSGFVALKLFMIYFWRLVF